VPLPAVPRPSSAADRDHVIVRDSQPFSEHAIKRPFSRIRQPTGRGCFCARRSHRPKNRSWPFGPLRQNGTTDLVRVQGRRVARKLTTSCYRWENVPGGDEVSSPAWRINFLASRLKLQTQSSHALRTGGEKKLQALWQIAIRDSKIDVHNQGMQSTREPLVA
jgi:hypothetical protein